MSTSHKVGALRVRPKIRDQKPTGKYIVDIPASLTQTGKRTRKLFDNRRTALTVAQELNRRSKSFAGPQTSPKAGLLFRAAAKDWYEHEKLRVATLKKRRASLTTDEFRLRSLIRFLGDRDIAHITEQDLIAFQRSRLGHGRRPATINSDLATFGSVMRWAIKQGHLDKAPATEQIPARRPRLVVPTPEEAARIIDALPKRLQPLGRFIAETGCRPGEAKHLEWDCVDEVNGWVEIRAREGWTPKTQESERRIPLNDAMIALLRELPKDGPYVFPGMTPDTPIGSFRKAFNTAVAKAGITRNGKPVHLTPKSFRKAHATWQALRGVNERVLQGLLGHAPGSRVTKQVYVQVTEEAKRAAVITLPLRDQI